MAKATISGTVVSIFVGLGFTLGVIEGHRDAIMRLNLPPTDNLQLLVGAGPAPNSNSLS